MIVSNAEYGLFGAVEELTDAQVDHMVATNLVGSIQLIPWSLSSSWQVYRARCTWDGGCAETRTPVRRIRNDGAISLNGRRPRLNGRIRQLMERSQFRVGDPI